MRTPYAFSCLVAAGLVAGCAGDALAPDRLGTLVPEFAVTPSVAPNGHFSANGPAILKGFNPVNPHRGDAIIATFFWTGSATITSVVDHETNGRSIGNQYNLVELVSAGGISMATYVAFNAQNFNDGFDERVKSGDSILVVQANMSAPISNGGVMITAWSGVQPTLLQALGAHSSRTGSSATQTMADPGAIQANPGALVYAVTMGNQVVGMDPPAPPFEYINQLSDTGAIKGDARRMVQGSTAGSVHPTWVWGFNSSTPRTWLASVLALNEAPTATNQPPIAAFTSSCSALTCTFTNTSSDPDGSIASSSWNFGDGQTSTAASPSHAYATAGTYNVTLTVTDNQQATNSVVHSVTVTQANQSPTAAFTSSCSNLTCSFTNTSSDPDGSIASSNWTFGDGQTSTAASPSHTYATAGTYNVTLTVTDNQNASNAVSHSVTVSQANQAPTANFTFSCSALNCSFTSTSSDPDGTIASYNWTFGDGATSSAQNPTHSYAAAGSYTVTLRVTDNQNAASAPVSKTVTVAAPNQSPIASFTKSCSGLTCSFTSTSSDPDGSITTYRWTFGDGASATTQNASHTYASGGTYTVTLQVTDNQGATRSASQSVTVTPPNKAPVVNAGPDQVVLLSLLGVNYTLNASFSDPDNGPWSYTITWGDGSQTTGTKTSAGTITATHRYANLISTRTVTVTVRDATGASGSDSKVLTLIL